jgi:hypothetical protein
MFLMDRFFDGTFLTFGIEVISFAERDQEDRIDPMVRLKVDRIDPMVIFQEDRIDPMERLQEDRIDPVIFLMEHSSPSG